MSDRIEHFRDEEWLELASGRAAPSRAKEMEDHLASGCGDCGQAYRTWLLVISAASRQREYEPPQDVVRSIKCAFAVGHNLNTWSRVAILARLVFDSFREPFPIGVRGATSAPRHLLHDSGSFVIDLRLENERAGRVFLAGQVLPKDAAGHDTAGANVAVADKQEQLLAQAIANSAGEFQVEYADARDLMLYLAIPSEPVIAIALPGPGANFTSANSV